jgi:hypothetical protein
MIVVVLSMAVLLRAVAVIGAVHWLEGFGDFRHGRSKPFQHGLDDMVALDQYPLFLDLRGEVAVAQMPGEFDLVDRVAGADLQKRLLCGNDFHMTRTVLEFEEIAMLEDNRLPEVEHHDVVMGHVKQLAAQMTLVMG